MKNLETKDTLIDLIWGCPRCLGQPLKINDWKNRLNALKERAKAECSG